MEGEKRRKERERERIIIARAPISDDRGHQRSLVDGAILPFSLKCRGIGSILRGSWL